MRKGLVFALVIALGALHAHAEARGGRNVTEALNDFSDDFWAWRSRTAPTSTDDLPRTAIVRPAGWAPNVSSASLDATALQYEHFARRLLALHRGVDIAGVTAATAGGAPASLAVRDFGTRARVLGAADLAAAHARC